MPMIKSVLDVNSLIEDQVVRQFYNVSGAGVSPYTPLFIDVAVLTNGVAATQAKSGAEGSLFLGVCLKDTDDSSYGVACVYGCTTIVFAPSVSAAITPGTLVAAKGTYFQEMTHSAAVTSGWDQVTLMETTLASAGFSTAAVTATYKAFIKAM